MPRIRMLTDMAGQRFYYRYGEEYDVTAGEAKVLCDGIRAELVRKPRSERSTATRAKVETTTR